MLMQLQRNTYSSALPARQACAPPRRATHWQFGCRALVQDGCRANGGGLPMADPPIDPVVSARMSRIRGKNTKPEIKLRKLAHHLGYRFRLHRRDLPGSPDLVFPARRKAIFVHGCFWHQHDCPTGQRAMRTRTAYWEAKFARNRARDARKEAELQRLGWEVLTIWECQMGDERSLAEQLVSFLGSAKSRAEP
jgi:DNA mismatch endonuclease (patch repair protein)